MRVICFLLQQQIFALMHMYSLSHVDEKPAHTCLYHAQEKWKSRFLVWLLGDFLYRGKTYNMSSCISPHKMKWSYLREIPLGNLTCSFICKCSEFIRQCFYYNYYRVSLEYVSCWHLISANTLTTQFFRHSQRTTNVMIVDFL